MRSTIRSILAAADLGRSTEDVLASAGGIASQSGADLHVLHVARSPRGSEADLLAGGDAHDDARRQVHEAVRDAGTTAATVEIRTGSAHELILERQREVGAGLVIVGPHEGGGVGAHFLGSTAERVVRAAEAPCLVARGRAVPPFRNVGVATDFSDASREALRLAAEWARVLGSGALRVLHLGQSLNRDSRYEEEVVRPEIERIRASGWAEGLELTTDFEWAQEESEGVVAWAARNDLDLLVVGTHGTRGIKRALLGSTANSVARKAACPVLLVPPTGAAG